MWDRVAFSLSSFYSTSANSHRLLWDTVPPHCASLWQPCTSLYSKMTPYILDVIRSKKIVLIKPELLSVSTLAEAKRAFSCFGFSSGLLRGQQSCIPLLYRVCLTVWDETVTPLWLSTAMASSEALALWFSCTFPSKNCLSWSESLWQQLEHFRDLHNSDLLIPLYPCPLLYNAIMFFVQCSDSSLLLLLLSTLTLRLNYTFNSQPLKPVWVGCSCS